MFLRFRVSSRVPLVAGAGLIFSIVPAQAQGLSGQSVDVTYRGTQSSTVVTDVGTQNIANGGTTFTQNEETSPFSPAIVPFMTIKVTPNQIVIQPTPNNYAIGFGNADFIGYAVTQVGLSPSAITGVTIDPSTSVSSFMYGNEVFGANRVTFDANDVFINLEGMQLSNISNVTLDLTTFSSAPVPEASTTVSFGLLLALGLGSIAIAVRKIRAAA